jgi:hypothetical protein
MRIWIAAAAVLVFSSCSPSGEPTDAGADDAGSADAGSADAGSADAGPANCPVIESGNDYANDGATDVSCDPETHFCAQYAENGIWYQPGCRAIPTCDGGDACACALADVRATVSEDLLPVYSFRCYVDATGLVHVVTGCCTD